MQPSCEKTFKWNILHAASEQYFDKTYTKLKLYLIIRWKVQNTFISRHCKTPKRSRIPTSFVTFINSFKKSVSKIDHLYSNVQLTLQSTTYRIPKLRRYPTTKLCHFSSWYLLSVYQIWSIYSTWNKYHSWLSP